MGFSLMGAGALYGCVPLIEKDIDARARAELGVAAVPEGWASFEIDGQRLIISGTAPDVAAQKDAVARLESLWGVAEVLNLTVVRNERPSGLDLGSRVQTRKTPAKVNPGHPDAWVGGTPDVRGGRT